MRPALWCQMPRRQLAAGTIGVFLGTLLAAAAPTNTPPPPRPLLRGAAAMGDWTSDAPGVRRLITAADLPKPFLTPSAGNGPRLVPRPTNAWPRVPPGFAVELFAAGLTNPRKIITAPNGDLFVAESRAGRVKVLRPTADGKLQQQAVFAAGLRQPFGLAFHPPGPEPRHLYVGNTDAVVRFPYRRGDLEATGPAEPIAALPGGGLLRGGGHWTRDVVFSSDGEQMFVSVGSRSNNSDDPSEEHRAAILQYRPDGTGFRVWASGLRNAVGLAIDPATGQLWASVNERDGLGDDLPPDYITRVQENGFYGWPWFYLGPNPDPKHAGKRPELADKVLVPDVLIQAHSASLCLAFYTGNQFPADYRGHAFAAEHGSWNRAKRTGYKVIRVPVEHGRATGEYEDFLTGFVTPDGEVWGRPVGVTVDNTGALLVTDDGGNCVWRVRYK